MCDIPIVIFSGGKSSRMGKDKALLPFAQYNSLAQYQYERLSKNFKYVYISTKTNKFDFEANIILDIDYQTSSPLIALISSLEFLKTDNIFILSVDAPFVDITTIMNIINQHQIKYDASIAKSPYGLEPLCGLYSLKILPIAKQELEKNNHSLRAMLTKAKTQFIEFNQKKIFTNLNYPTDYKQALSLLD